MGVSNGFVQPHVESWQQWIPQSCRFPGDAHMVRHRLPDAMDDSGAPGGAAVPLPLPAPVIFWSIAALTLAFAWPARHNTNRG